jgi:hypothetical protein
MPSNGTRVGLADRAWPLAAPFTAARVAPFRSRPPDDKPEPERCGRAGESSADLLRRAEALGIPWERILRGEIRAEERLRAFIADLGDETPLWSLVSLLSHSFFRSWRVRDRIECLAQQAQGPRIPAAVRGLRRLFRRLTTNGGADRVSLTEHLWFAYQRVLLLQRVSRAAAKGAGLDTADRLTSVCASTRCSYDDAVWAICLEASHARGHRLDAAMRKAREEGFQIPRLENEAKSFAQLRRTIRSAGQLPRRRASRTRSRPRRETSLPARVAHPVDAL